MAEGVLEKDQSRVELLEFLDEQPLVSVITREPVRREHDNGVEFAKLDGIA
jgi:hypothetical protein